MESQTRNMKKEWQDVKGMLKAAEEKNSKLQQQLSSRVEEIKNLHSQIQEDQEKKSSNIKPVFPSLALP